MATTPDTLDVISLEEAKAAINLGEVPTTTDDAVDLMVTAVSRYMDDVCGPIVKRTITGEVHDGGRTTLRLRHTPVLSVTTITEYVDIVPSTLTVETNSAKLETNYTTLGDPAGGLVIRRTYGNDSPFSFGRGNVLVTYVAGRFNDTDTVDRRFKAAAQVIFANLWRAERAAGSSIFGGGEVQQPTFGLGFAMPNRARQLLGDELRVPRIA